MSSTAAAQTLVLSNVGNPTSVGAGVGKRAIWVNAGTVGATTVDLVATLSNATLNHSYSTQTSRAALTSVGVEDVWMTWHIYQAGTYDINTNSGGVAVVADIHVQLNDIDGPNNERAYVPICDGTVSFVRVQKTATTGRAFGTITGRPQIFSLIGDKTYNSEPESGVEVFYPSTSSFSFGRRANTNFYIRVSSPTYSAFDTFDYQCADFATPAAVDDTTALVAGANTIAILQNDSVATSNPSGNPSEWGIQAVSLTAPAGATAVVVDASGHTTGFTVPGQGTWSYDDTTGLLTFTPVPGLIGSPTPVSYVFYNALTPAPGVASNAATVTLVSPLLATNDTPASVDGSAGNASVTNIFTNDTAGGTALDPSQVTTTITAQTSPNVNVDTSTGIVSVAPGTAAGSYTISYQICEIAVPTNCSTATVTVPVAGGTIAASTDGPYGVNGTSGSTNAGNAYANDTLSGAAVDPTKVTGSILSQTSSNVTLDTSTGTISVAPNTPAGSYTISYQICEQLNPANCATSTVTVNVTAAVADATNDGPFSINGTAGSVSVVNAFANDTLNGVAVDPADVTVTITSQTSGSVTMDVSTGVVSVAPNTPAATYMVNYQICQNINPTNCDAAVVTVNVTAATVDATDDGPFSINGTDGSASVVSAFANDTLNGVAANPSDLTATITSQSSANVTMDVSTGLVSVAPNTPAGAYSINYQICQTINPSNCNPATITVNVSAAPISAADEGPFAADGFAGDPNVGNVYANDTVNGQPTTGSDVTTTIIAQTGTDVTIDTSTGVISVAPQTPAGTYTLDYQICQIINPLNCDTATVTVSVAAPPIDAADDAPAVANGSTGNPSVTNVFANDTLGGAALDPSDVNVQVTIPASNPNVQLNTGTGVVSVAAGTSAGSYTLTYEICDKINPTSCDTATITITVSAATITAADDTPPQVNGASGNANVINAFTNDTLNGAAVNPASITATIVTPATDVNVQLHPATGTVSVAAGTTAGNYTIVYQICENLNPTNCDSATITVAVGEAVVVANDDAPTATAGIAGDPNLLNVLANDTIDGAPATTSTVSIAIVTQASNANVALDPATGIVSVAPNTPAGNYTITYQACEIINPTNCDPATIIVNVSAATINAVNDTPPATTSAGNANLITAFTNDTLNGAPVDPATTTATITAQTSPNVTMNVGSGTVSVAPGTLAGTYTVDYQLCEDINPTNCDSATVTVTVNPDVIDALDDTSASVSGSAGSANAVNAFANDTLAGAALNPVDITATIVTAASSANVQLDLTSGIVSVAANTPQGSYTIVYRICQTINPTNCDTATVTVPVGLAVVDAVDDAPASVFSGVNNSTIGNAFANDTLGGAPVVVSQITASVLAQSDPNVQLAVSTGVISAGATVAAGTYTIDYRICETLNPANCDNARITVTIVAPAIRAVDDAPAPVGSAGSANLGNAFANDTLNGGPFTTSAITATILTPASNSNVAMNVATGTIAVAPNTAAGTYTIDYRICENLNPANCDDATITVVVDTALIQAVNDSPPPVASVIGSANLGNAFSNDTLNGAAVSTAAITATIVTLASNPGVALDAATGVISVAPNTPPAIYTIGYRICETINPSNCADATITVTVNASSIQAIDDTPPAISSFSGSSNLANAFANDTLNGTPVALSAITSSIVTPASSPNVALDAATGVISVLPNTPAGAYTIDYRICETTNATNCSDATITVVVTQGVIDAVNDSAPAPFDSKDPIPGALNVLGNDTVNGAAATSSSVTVAAVGTMPAGITLDSRGHVDIAEDTASGTYTFNYEICEILNPTNCDTATVTLQIRKSTPSISGYVYFDANGNGLLDPNEDHLPGYRVELRRNGQVVQQTVSDESGFYQFVDFPPGDGYEIVFIDPDANIAIGRIGPITIEDDTDLDDLNQPINPGGVFYNSETGAPLAGATLELRTAAGIRLPDTCLLPNQQGQTTDASGRYKFNVISGAAAACPAGRTEYRLYITAYPSGTRPQVSVVAPPQQGAIDGSICPQDAVPGGACQLSASSSPPQPGAPTPYFLSFLIGQNDREIINNHVPLDPVVAVSPSGLSISKRANVSVARRDDVVSYVIIAANDNNAEYGPVDVKDQLPAGLVMVPGSGKVGDTAVEPLASGRNLTFEGLTIPARGTVEVRLSVRIGADVSPGDYVNQAWITDTLTGEALTAIAKATVRLVAEHAFDCGEIIGKVFDDHNRDGRQTEGEKGLPGVRVVTVNGVLITTDKHGRFSVPCAELPDQDIGSNFIMKLDTRTLPDGFRLTTENPRVVRLTAGKVTKLNFGATAGTTIRVDLTGRAFGKKSAKPSGELADGIGRLAEVTDKKGSVLKVTYTAGGEPVELVDARVKNIRAMIAKVWRDRGKSLSFEVRVVGME